MAHKILVLRSDRLGDIILCSGYLASLKESWPDTRIDLWVSREMKMCEQILHPDLHVRALPFPRSVQCEDQLLTDWLRQIEQEAYDSIIIPQFTLGYPEILALGYLSIQQRWGFRNYEFGSRPEWIYDRLGQPLNAASDWIREGPAVEPFSPEVTKYHALAEAQGLSVTSVEPRLSGVHPCGQESRRGVLVWPGCGSEERRWAHFPELVVSLGHQEVTVGGTAGEIATVTAVVESLRDSRIEAQAEYRSESSLKDTANWVSRFQWVLTNDTGIAHLASALGCKVVAVSGGQHQGRFVLHGKSSLTVFSDVPCRRCRGLCLFEETPFPCVAAISPQDVAQLVTANRSGAAFLSAPRFFEPEAMFSKIAEARTADEEARHLERLGAHRTVEQTRRSLREAEQSRDQWEQLCREAEIQRDRYHQFCHDAEQQRDHFRQLCTDAAEQRDHFRNLYSESELQRDQVQRLFHETELQRDRWEQVCHETQLQRDRWEQVCHEAEQQRDRWEQLCHEAEQQRDQWKSLCNIAEEQRDRFYRHFPWAVEKLGSDQSLPKISIVTPSFEQGSFIGETIQSVLDQQYPNFEHIVVDAGSRDKTVEILKEHPHLRWVSEADLGQSHAINKGLLMSTGEIVAYLNSDDAYRPGAFSAVARFFQEHPDVQIVAGDCSYINEHSETTGHLKARLDNIEGLIRYWGWDKWYCLPQQSVFMRRSLLTQIGLFDVSLHMAMDYDMWLRAAKVSKIAILPQTLAAFRLCPNTKTTSKTHLMYYEELWVSRKHWHLLPFARRTRVAIEAHHHLSRKLLDVAEHYGLNGLEPGLVPWLVIGSARHWPLGLLYPRLVFTALGVLSPKGKLKGAVHKLHRFYLGLKWRAQNLSARSVRSA